MVLELYRIMDEDSSVIRVTQLKMAPDMIPFTIIGVVTFQNVLNFDAPRLADASSTVMGICCRIATLLRMV